jgi:hypothetical protein
MIKRHDLGRPHVRACSFTSTAVAVAAAFATLAASGKLHAHDGDVDLSVIPSGTSGLLPDLDKDPTQDGVVGPLLPMHTMSVHNTLVWKRGIPWPGMLMFHRHSAYRADEVANPDVVHFLIDNPNPTTGLNAFGSSSNQFNSAMRRTFQQFCYGGYNIIHDVSQSVPTRIRVDQTRELTQLWDMNHPDAFKYDFSDPIYSAALLNNSDAELNVAAFKDMGFSKGLFYDMYCPGFGTMEDGRPIFAGGHDMNSQNGLYRIQVFDPDLETWAPRPISCMRDLYGSDPNDPFLEHFYEAEVLRLAAEGLPASEIFNFYLPIGNSLSGDCDPHDIDPTSYSATYPQIRLLNEGGTVTQPGNLTSDMRYARWYPTVVALPGNRMFIFAGWDRDEIHPPQQPATVSSTTTAMIPFIEAKAANPELYPDLPAMAHLSGNMKSGGDNNFLSSRVKIPVPEVYDGTRDTTVALENARLFHGGWYPNGLVVQTGPGRDDWAVGVNDASLLEDVPGGVTDGQADRTYRNLWLIDVQGAMKDTARDTPSVREGKYVQFVSEATNSHTAFTGNTNMMELDKTGKILWHKLTHFGGQRATTGQTDDIEQINFAGLSKKITKKDPAPGPAPQWTVLEPKLYQPARQNYATPLPDGTMVLLGGNGGTLPGIESWSLHLQHFIPSDAPSRFAMPGMDMMNKLAKSLIPRDEHGIIQLMPDATVYLGGQNRNGLVRAGDPVAPLGDSDLGVPCGQIYRPPYLFDPATGAPAERPAIVKGPETVHYGKPFKVSAFASKGIMSICLIRTGSMSHSLNTDCRYLKLAFKTNGKATTGMLNMTVYPPKLPATAVGGYYYLFVVDEAGVPSVAKVCVVGKEVDKRLKALRKAKLLASASVR